MEQLKNLLTAPYNQDIYRRFSNEFLKNVDSISLIDLLPPPTYKETVQSYQVFGTYVDDNGKKILILSVKIQDNSNARSAQRNFVSYLLANDFVDCNAALVAYHDGVRENWKLSLVTIEYELNDNGIELVFKPAKRFSFLVGKDEPTKTYIQQLAPIYDSDERPTLEGIEDAFSVARLSKDFYDDYKNKYFELYDYLIKNKVFIEQSKKIGYDDVNKFATIFCKKTLGQIMFLHFIQKKGWLGAKESWNDGDRKYLINSTKSDFGRNYFNDFIEPLFYNALNVKRLDDLYLGVKIPFLNGGLFQPIDEYDWGNCNFNIPNDYWFNQKENGLLDILSQYNFTVDESNPDEQELAIDPEMLGKIFESLLDTNDRSTLGAFYTPREIVSYMCEETLASKISKDIGIKQDEILDYIKYADTLKSYDSIKEKAKEIDNYVSNITIIDAAVGSGAFLVGMLGEIVKLRTNLSFIAGNQKDKYELKKETIQKSLYGVDIENDAIEIAKLRLWLSLIVDQEACNNKPEPLPNLNFHLRAGNSLVDSINGIKLWNERWRGNKINNNKKIQTNLFNIDTVNDILFRLKQDKIEFFNTSDVHKKQELYELIETEQYELIKSELIAKGEFKLYEEIKESIKRHTKPFFIWDLEFEEVFENGGFDIAIMNPPYVGEDENKKIFEPIKDSTIGKKFYQGKMDLLYFFFHLALDITKNNGTACFITTNYFVTADGAKKLRKDLKERSNILQIINFNNFKIFDSAKGQHNMITLLEKKEGTLEKECTIIDINEEGSLSRNKNFMVNIKNDNGERAIFKISNQDLYYGDKNFIINRRKYSEGSIESKIISMLSSEKHKLRDFCLINQGLVTGANKVIESNLPLLNIEKDDIKKGDGIFILDYKNERDISIKNSFNDDEKSFLRPYFKNSDIYKYFCSKENTKEVIYINREVTDLKTNKNVYKHLLKYKSVLDKRRETANGLIEFFQLQWPRDEKMFSSEKIMVPYRSKDNIFGYCNVPWFFSTDCYAITLKKGYNRDQLFYTLAILNSKIYRIWFENRGKVKGDILEFMPTMLEETPILEIPGDIKKEIVNLAKTIVNKIDNELIVDISLSSEYKKIDEILCQYIACKN